jgi:hypothetical protein
LNSAFGGSIKVYISDGMFGLGSSWHSGANLQMLCRSFMEPALLRHESQR